MLYTVGFETVTMSVGFYQMLKGRNMNLSVILSALDIDFDSRGDQSFDSLGLNVQSNGTRMCSFIRDEKYIGAMSVDIKLLITTRECAEFLDGFDICIVENPTLVFFSVHDYLASDPVYRRPARNTTIGEGANISKFACIAESNVEIGKNVVIEEFVSIKENTAIGDNSIIRAGSVIGGEGYDPKKRLDGILGIVKHLGGVAIGENVEIQCNTCVDRAVYPWDDTVIGDSTLIDNLSHIAHAVKIGNNARIAGATIPGRVVIGDGAWIGPSSVVINGASIGEGARVNIGAVVLRDVPAGVSVFGNPARVMK
jgi:UDP-3-O-[3-hydroxymyristoyl] glucosamine N-acyltransferase